MFTALATEAQEVNKIKKSKRFTVVIGNPPYSNYGQLNRIPFVLNLLEEYKRELKEKKLNLDDDYLKFFRFGQYVIDTSTSGILGLVTNSSYLDGVTHRRMRESLLRSFSVRVLVDLHGSSRRRELGPGGSVDENVFDILQGVAVSVWAKCTGEGRNCVSQLDLWGGRQAKYEWLSSHVLLAPELCSMEPTPPMFFFVRQNSEVKDEYETGPSLSDIFQLMGSGLNTDRDALCIDFDKEPLARRMKQLFAGQFDNGFRDTYNLHPSSSYDPGSLAKRQAFDPTALRLCIYRPFDFRHIYYKVGFTSRPVFEIQGHMLKANWGLLACRQTKEPFAVLVTEFISTHKIVAVYDRTSLAPLYAYPDIDAHGKTLNAGSARIPNLRRAFLRRLAERLGLPQRGPNGLPEGISAEDVLQYVYAVFYSPGFRTRYAELLKTDFPRLPLTSDRGLFRSLVDFGAALLSLHLMKSPEFNKPITRWRGTTPSGETEKVTYADQTVWIDKSQTTGFRGVPEDVWDFHIGGYHVCEKWLKDRKGRQLSAEDIAHYQKIVVALAETIRIMGEIDRVIDEHGGWPGAFVTNQLPSD